MADRRNEIAVNSLRGSRAARFISVVYCTAALLLATPLPAVADGSTSISKDDEWVIYPNVGKVIVEIGHAAGSHAGVKIVTTFNSLDGSGPIQVPPVPVFVGDGQRAKVTLQRDGYMVQRVEFTGISGTASINVNYDGCCM